MSVIEPILRRLPPKVVIPALLAIVLLLGGRVIASWGSDTAALKANIAKADDRLDKLDISLAAELASSAQYQRDVSRRLDSIERKLDRALSRRDQ
jgi:hypothetical protein